MGPPLLVHDIRRFGIITTGSAGQVATQSSYLAKAYWKNGALFFLTDPSIQSSPACIATYGSDVYIGGMQATPNGCGYNAFEACYWKNGVPTILPWPGGALG